MSRAVSMISIVICIIHLPQSSVHLLNMLSFRKHKLDFKNTELWAENYDLDMHLQNIFLQTKDWFFFKKRHMLVIFNIQLQRIGLVPIWFLIYWRLSQQWTGKTFTQNGRRKCCDVNLQHLLPKTYLLTSKVLEGTLSKNCSLITLGECRA